jgi:hypothetical protein
MNEFNKTFNQSFIGSLNHLTRTLSLIFSLSLLDSSLFDVKDRILVKLNIFITLLLKRNFLSYLILYRHSLSVKSWFSNKI